MKILNCVPNISEGKNQDTINAVAEAIRSVPGVKLISVSADEDHNRAVYSFLGEPNAVLEAAKRMAAEAINRIDMAVHIGGHPRMGAVDVTPFIPVSGIETDEAVAICKEYGKWVGERGIPVFYYEETATKPGRVSLADVRKGQYEGLEEKLRDPEWTPDEGPCQFVPKSGAFLVGVRMPLIAYNVNLWTEDVGIAKKIADSVRNMRGGYRYVRAMGLALEGTGMVQVSMNLTNYLKTPIPRVTETIRSEAARYGVRVAGTEIVGAIPLKAMEEIMKHYLQCHDFTGEQVIEMNCLAE